MDSVVLEHVVVRGPWPLAKQSCGLAHIQWPPGLSGHFFMTQRSGGREKCLAFHEVFGS